MQLAMNTSITFRSDYTSNWELKTINSFDVKRANEIMKVQLKNSKILLLLSNEIFKNVTNNNDLKSHKAKFEFNKIVNSWNSKTHQYTHHTSERKINASQTKHLLFFQIKSHILSHSIHIHSFLLKFKKNLPNFRLSLRAHYIQNWTKK